jgi:NitT/TauT family transport system ATP-binding protein
MSDSPDLVARLLAPDRLRPAMPGRGGASGLRDAPAEPRSGLPGRVELEGITRSFAGPHGRIVALEGVDLTIDGGDVVALIGPNGSGKSTLLRVVAGLLPPDRGQVLLDGRPITAPAAGIGFVFQEPRLLPWRTVVENIAYPLELAGRPVSERRERVTELLELVGLVGAADLVPSRLSGGMRQRAALARGLALSPRVLLLDEPFSALDALTRERLNLELLSLWSRLRSTILLVTHSIPEAILVGDRVVVLSGRPGRVVADLKVPLGRPRRPEALHDPAAGRLAGQIRSALEAE